MKITHDQIDVLKEVINVGVGRAAKIMNAMTGFHVVLHVPEVRVALSGELNEMATCFGEECLASVQMKFNGSFAGSVNLVFPAESASQLVAAVEGCEVDTEDLDSLRIGTLSEAGNIIINGVMGSISNALQTSLSYSFPAYREDSINEILQPFRDDPSTVVLWADTRFTIESLDIACNIILIFELGSFDTVINALDSLVPA